MKVVVCFKRRTRAPTASCESESRDYRTLIDHRRRRTFKISIACLRLSPLEIDPHFRLLASHDSSTCDARSHRDGFASDARFQKFPAREYPRRAPAGQGAIGCYLTVMTTFARP